MEYKCYSAKFMYAFYMHHPVVIALDIAMTSSSHWRWSVGKWLVVADIGIPR